jgi:hypothetical protein
MCVQQWPRGGTTLASRGGGGLTAQAGRMPPPRRRRRLQAQLWETQRGRNLTAPGPALCGDREAYPIWANPPMCCSDQTGYHVGIYM